MRSGFTLPELAFVLMLMGLAATAVLPAARRQAGRTAVAGARETVAELVARTRIEAMLHGGAALRLRVAGARIWVLAGDSVVVLRSLSADFGVTLELGEGASEAQLAFDALGLGRRASRSVILRRRGAEARLVVAAYGRVLRS